MNKIGHRYPWNLIEKAVILHLKEGLNYRQVSNKIKNIGVNVSHKTVFEWVKKFKNDVKIKKFKNETVFSIDTENVTCNGENMVMHKLLDSRFNIRDIFFNERKNTRIAKRHFEKNINSEIELK